jgi:hypothetical protein
MSDVSQERLARRLTFGMAALVAATLLLVGWALYSPVPRLAEPVASTGMVHGE